MAKTKTFTTVQVEEMKSLEAAVNEATKARNAFREKNEGIGPFYLQSLATAVFDENPKLTSFSWRQYTPSFNDGDACYFGADTDYPDINGYNEDDEEGENTLTDAERKDLRKKVVAFLRQFNNDQLENWYGDGYKITVTRDGFTKDEYGDY